MLIKNKKVAIIGGGPGGLTLARLLQLKGVAVKVYERDFSGLVRAQGATLDLHFESGLLALEKAGLLAAFKANYRPNADRLRVVDEHAQIYLDEHQSESNNDFGDELFRPEIDRGPLRNLLLESLQKDTVVWDSQLISLKNKGNAWEIVFQNGKTTMADIVIGADGGKSKVRSLVTPIQPFYSGVTVLEGNIYDSKNKAPQIHELLQGGKVMALGDSKTISVSAKGDGSLDFYLGCKVDPQWISQSGIDFGDRKQVLAWFKSAYKKWDPIWTELFETADTQFTPRPQYCMPLDQRWDAQSNLTLIGDAAHLMPPYAGEGVNMAMLDALQLSESLTSEGFIEIRAAIANYEKQMFSRFAIIGKETMHNTVFMHSPNGLHKLLEMFDQG